MTRGSNNFNKTFDYRCNHFLIWIMDGNKVICGRIRAQREHKLILVNLFCFDGLILKKLVSQIQNVPCWLRTSFLSSVSLLFIAFTFSVCNCVLVFITSIRNSEQ